MEIGREALRSISPRNILRVSLAAGCLVAGGLVAGCGEEVRASGQPIADEELLPYDCRYNIRNRQPIVSASPLRVKVWGYCQTPPDAPASIFPRPLYERGTGIGVVYNGDVVEVKCKIKGDDPDHPITDHAHSSLAASHIWLKIQAPRKRKSKVGYMSVVNLGFPSTNKIQGC